jgi:hypothetical protein
MQRSTPNPMKYLLGAALPTASHDAVIYFVVCQADGKSIMGKNYVHSVVNTHGCWMMFRNFNWPATQADAFELLYRKDRDNKAGNIPAALAALGYDDAGQAGIRSNSETKWFFYDRNFAYFWFCKEIVGINYFSKLSWLERDRFPRHPFPPGQFRSMNEHNTHERVFEKGFPLVEASNWRSFQPGLFAYHDAGDDPKFKATDALFGVNALGFRTSAGFAATSFPTNIPPDRAWADLYFYKEDGVDVRPGSSLVAKDALDIPGSKL